MGHGHGGGALLDDYAQCSAAVAGRRPLPVAPADLGCHPAHLGQHALVVQREQRGEDLLAREVARGANHHHRQRALVPVLWLQPVCLYGAIQDPVSRVVIVLVMHDDAEATPQQSLSVVGADAH